MNIPSFTGEASLYNASRHYYTAKLTTNSSIQMINTIYPVMMRDDRINCSNCVGAECAELRCFENWTHSGGGPGGPYQGSSERNFPGPLTLPGTRLKRVSYCCGSNCTTENCPVGCEPEVSCDPTGKPSITCCW